MIRYVKLRLNLEKPEDAKAYSFIQGSDKSQSRFLISAVNAYGSYLNAEEEKKVFLQTVQSTIRDAIRETFGGGLFLMQNAPRETSTLPRTSEESGEIADEFLKSLI